MHMINYIYNININFCLSTVIQFLAIPLLFNTFMHLRTKNSFDRYMIERRGKTRQQENPTPHTHFIPRGLQDSTKIKAKDVLTDANSEKEADVLFSQDEKKVNIYTVDVWNKYEFHFKSAARGQAC